MRNRILKVAAIGVFTAGSVVLWTLGEAPVVTEVNAAVDAAATYKAKCAMCHTAKAEKFFDPAKAEDEQVQTVLKGKKGEKPPYMPGYEDKGITADDAKELVKYMHSLKAAQ